MGTLSRLDIIISQVKNLLLKTSPCQKFAYPSLSLLLLGSLLHLAFSDLINVPVPQLVQNAPLSQKVSNLSPATNLVQCAHYVAFSRSKDVNTAIKEVENARTIVKLVKLSAKSAKPIANTPLKKTRTTNVYCWKHCT